MVLCAGTSDIPVAEEAALCAEAFGNRVARVYDVGVAGIHRLTANLDAIREASVLIVVAGMEGALPSVVAGLVDKPVIAVPTSVGYGTSMGGLAALLGMLNSLRGRPHRGQYRQRLRRGSGSHSHQSGRNRSRRSADGETHFNHQRPRAPRDHDGRARLKGRHELPVESVAPPVPYRARRAIANCSKPTSATRNESSRARPSFAARS